MLHRLSLVLRSAIYVTGFMLFWLWLMPRWLNLRTSTTFPFVTPARWIGLVPLLLGASVAIACFANFVAVGQGTPAPFDAPRKLVISGPYRYARNPMYVGAGLFWRGARYCSPIFRQCCFGMRLDWSRESISSFCSMKSRLSGANSMAATWSIAEMLDDGARASSHGATTTPLLSTPTELSGNSK